MSPSEFVNAIKTEVLDAASSDTINQLHAPAGQRPTDNLKRLSSWFNELSKVDQKNITEVVAMASHNSVFGFLCVLDGVRPIQEGYQTGKLNLTFVAPDKSLVRLNPATGDMLHDLLNSFRI